ncbi:hypothetical protein FEF30_02060 [Mesomycoplasma hyopneumoniae]|uniref:ICEF-II n=2 Tax=Mesomycoplasma hyopneumoniae TaxID=2099 RepID=A0ABD4SYC4_MESHO|nr:hypothetical protein [Mesomycoplasma hyopneumoniae]
MSYWKSYINYKLDQGEIIDPVQAELEKKLDKSLEEYLKKNEIDINQKINLDLDIGNLANVLSDNQKKALNFDTNSNKIKAEFELKSNQNNKYIFELTKSQDLNLNKSFQFLGLKPDSIVKKEKKGKTEIDLKENIEKGIEQLLKENPNASQKELRDLISNNLSSWINNPNIYSIFKSKDNSKFEFEFGSFDKNLYLNKNKFEFNLNSLQEKAKRNQNIFDQLPKKIINLKGINNPEKALEYIKSQIKDLSKNKLIFNKNFKFSSTDSLLKNIQIFRPQKGNPNNLDLANSIKLGLEGINLPGFEKLKIVNVVPNSNLPNIKDLSSINLGTIKINGKTDEEIASQLFNNLNFELAKYNLNLQDYFKDLDFNSFLEKFRTNKLSEFKLEPSNFLTNGVLNFKVDNSALDSTFGKGFQFDSNSSNIESSDSKLWIIPIVLISIISLGIGGIFFYRRKIKRYNS